MFLFDLLIIKSETEMFLERHEQVSFSVVSPEAVVGLQDVHDGSHRRSEDFVHGEHGGVASGLVVSGDAGVLDAQVLKTHGETE